VTQHPDGVGDKETRVSSRLGRGIGLGAIAGAIIGGVLGALLGAWAFDRVPAIAASAIAGAVGLGLLGAFGGGMSGLESPDPGAEPSQRTHPLEDPELVSEEDLPKVRDVDGEGVHRPPGP
jgi:hypothetical protein